MPKEYFEVNEIVLMYAFRYALGRDLRTAENVGGIIRFYWKDLSESFRDQVRREIRVMIERSEAGDSNAIIYWDRLSLMT